MRLAIVILVLLACLAAALVLVFVLADDGEEQEVIVLVAARDLPPRTRIDANHVMEIPVPETAIANKAGYLVDATEAIGKVSRQPVSKGEILTDSCLVTDNTPPPLVFPGKRAFTLSVANHSIEGGPLRAGCKVNIYAVFDSPEAEPWELPLFEEVRVLVVNTDPMVRESEDAEASSPDNPLIVTVEVNVWQAGALQTALKKATLRLEVCEPEAP